MELFHKPRITSYCLSLVVSKILQLVTSCQRRPIRVTWPWIVLPSWSPSIDAVERSLQLAKIHNSSLNTINYTRNNLLRFWWTPRLFWPNCHIRHIRCIFPYLDFITSCTIATSIVHSKFDYCNLTDGSWSGGPLARYARSGKIASKVLKKTHILQSWSKTAKEINSSQRWCLCKNAHVVWSHGDLGSSRSSFSS